MCLRARQTVPIRLIDTTARAWMAGCCGLALLGLRVVGAPAAPEAHVSTRYSPLADITPANVARLETAWTAHTGVFAGGKGLAPTTSVEGFQARPVLVGDQLIVTTTTSLVIALDAETGAERWRFDPFDGRTPPCERPNRGVAVWAPGDGPPATIFSGTCDGRLAAIDTHGRAVRTFGNNGLLDLRPGVGALPTDEYAVTSPPAIYRDLVIVGALVPEGTARGPAGDVRAFDAHSGREVWRFHTVPRPGEPGHDTWSDDAWQRRTGVNVWSQMAVDQTRGLVFLPIGSASYDFYGGDRPGADLYANTLVALDARTGVRRWHFQLVHHDLWDYDLPAQPILADIVHLGRVIPAVIQVTKMGLVFVLDRTTGTPVFGVQEQPVPQSDAPGEASAATQPFPIKPAPLGRVAPLTRADLTTVTEASARECAALFDRVQSGGIFTPPGRELTVWFPGTLGGATWSGASVDPGRGYLIVNTNEIGALGQIVPAAPGLVPAFRRASPFGEYARFWDSNRLPCQQPPWGRLTAIDLATGDVAWQVPFGDAPQLAAAGVRGTGTPSLGGAITTAGGLTFIGATNDARFRAFDTSSGKVLWETALPASAHATPITYRGPRSGRQFVVVAAGGGGKLSSTISDTVVAFALPGPPASAARR
jgi:glucose dehydrogenase